MRIQPETNSTIVTGGCVMSDQAWDDAEIRFQARAPAGTEQVQIWAGFRCRDRDSRYVFALRGGHDNDLYLARYAPDGGAKFLGFTPLGFRPVPGVWYHLRVVTLGNRIQIYLNDETLPRLNVVDDEALWTHGGVALGGGWLPTEFANLQVNTLTDDDKTAFLAMGDEQWSEPEVNKDALRVQQRSAYRPATFPPLNPLRTELSLVGNWLFKPDYELPPGKSPVKLDDNDQDWHVLAVPSFWTPGLSWLHGETSFPAVNEFSTTKAVAESLVVQETKRCDAYTFDWRRTDAAWYRHYVDLPDNIEGRRFELCFDAIAKVSEIWINGTKVGTHTGMFGQVKCDVTGALKAGRNIIAVHVIGRPPRSGERDNTVEGVAVTVEVTSAMLHSLPHGMFQDNVGGIWQPVKLTATSPVMINDCFIQPGLHGAGIQLDVLNSSQQPAALEVGYSIVSARDGTLLYSNDAAAQFSANAGATQSLNLETPRLDPQLWSPQQPNLYVLRVSLKEAGREIDEYNTQFGFRTFRLDGDKLLLNEQAFHLRGANPFPNTLRPNDATLANRFMRIARAGNVNMTRSHIVPYTSTWLDAADENGMAVSFEGTWPWLMLEGAPPDDDLINVWRSEFISLIKEYRNHPSIVLWTVNNEMKFEQFDQHNPSLLQSKWTILDATIKEMRRTDPTRPIVADSAYTRKDAKKSYQTVVKPEGLDDGDMDDAHHYYGWYNESFFHFFNDNNDFNQQSTAGRPLISQEMATGYPNNDDGHPVRFYLFKNYTPQALVGDDAYENADPAIFLKRQAFMTKELAETLRRTSRGPEAGELFFSYLTWFQAPWSAGQIKPWPAYYALKTALQPVLVSAELFGRHFYAGASVPCRICLVNDSENYRRIESAKVIWKIQFHGQTLAQGQADAPPVNYGQNKWLKVNLVMPADLPAARADGQLQLQLEADGKVLSENSYDLTIATAGWTQAGHRMPAIQLWDPAKSAKKIFGADANNTDVTTLNSPSSASLTNVLVVGNLRGHSLNLDETLHLRNFVAQGGQVLMLHPGPALAELYPDQIASFKSTEGEIVSMHIPESPVFSGIEPLDLAWFQRPGRQLPIACTGVFQVRSPRPDVRSLAWQCDLHGYLKNTSDITNISGSPLVEIRSGKGRLLASEMNFEAAGTDPIARRLLINAVHSLQPASSPRF